jgi:1A family penicillin-binding protein
MPIHPIPPAGERRRPHRVARSRRLLAALTIPVCLGFGGMSATLIALRQAPLPEGTFAQPSIITASDGQVLANWPTHGFAHREISLSEIPRSLQEATLAVEDAHFYDHHALSLTALARALLVDATHGRVVEGGSTITQQLAKNLFLSQDRTLTRKLREALYALQLELHESKADILQKYLNVIYYGHGAYGVEAASQLYFGKPVRELTLAESALIAGLPKGPELYSPFRHFTAAKARQRQVLDRMVACGFLTPADAAQAYRQPLDIQARPNLDESAPYLPQVAVDESRRRFHLSLTDLERGGVHITTTLDPFLQAAAERAIATTLPHGSKMQVALVALDPQTGAIQAMVGGRDYHASTYNRVFAERQPGSTFKAILYAAAIERGWSPAREINSEQTTFVYDADGTAKRYTVHDFGDFYAHRPLTLREALARSDNVYAVTTNLELGPQAVVKTARRMGITTPLQPYPSLALGVFPANPLQMATAYATLANGGHRIEPFTVQGITTPKGRQIAKPRVGERVVSVNTAFILSDLLTSVLNEGGTAYAVRHYLHGPAAAKTGTTDSDAWMVGYTPRTVCAVWVGYDDNRQLSRSESHLAAPIWAKFMGAAQQHLPSTWYTPPAGLVRRTIDPATGLLAARTCRTTETDYFLPGTEPRSFCTLHSETTALPDSRPWWKRLWRLL